MIINFKNLSELYAETVSAIASSPQSWKSFLSCSANNYKLRFDEQVLLFAQRPDSTAVLDMERWNKRFGRWVNSKATGIAVFANENRKSKRIIHYFDISDTHETENAKPVPIWQMKPEYEQRIIETLEATFGDLENTETLAQAIFSSVSIEVKDSIDSYVDEFEILRSNSSLSEYTAQEAEKVYTDLVINSVTYTTLSRLGIDSESVIDGNVFSNINLFKDSSIINTLGIASAEISKKTLQEVAKTINALDKTEILTENKIETNLDRSYDNGNHLHRGRWDSVPGLSSGGEPRNRTGNVRSDEREVPEGTQKGNIHNVTDEQHVGRTPDGSGTESTGVDRQVNRGNESSAWSDRGTQEERPDGLGSGNEQHHKRSKRDSKYGSDLRLDHYDDKNEDKNLPFYGGREEIREMFLSTPHLKASNAEILAYYTKEQDKAKRAEFIKSIFNNDFTEVIISNDKRCGYKAYENGLLIWEGAYLTRTRQSFYKWSQVAECYNTARLFSELTNGYLNLFNGAEDKTSAFVFPQEIIDNDLCRGSGFANGKMRIYEQFEKSLSHKDNADFLKNEYGIGGRSPIVEGAYIDQSHNGKGITYSYDVKDNSLKLTLKWIDVAKRIQYLINQDLYLSEEEKLEYPVWLDKQEQRRAELAVQKKNLEILSVAPKSLETPEIEYEYKYKLGDTVYIGTDEYQIISLDDNRVLLYDTKYPLFNKELTSEEFDNKIKENPLNDHLKVIKSNNNELIGKEVEIDGHRFVIERIGKISNDVSMRDITLEESGIPINRVEKLDYVRSLLRQQNIDSNSTLITETEAVYSAEQSGLPYDVVIEKLSVVPEHNDLEANYTDAFFVNDGSNNVEWVYYNPDGNDGKGQFVTNLFTYDDIIKAAELYTNESDFFDYLGSVSKQTISDRGTKEFKEDYEYFHSAVDLTDCTKDTMQSLIDEAQSEVQTQNDIDEQKKENSLSFSIGFSEHPAFYDKELNDRYNNISFALGNKLLGVLDEKQHRERATKENVGWYHKTDFEISGVIDGEDFKYNGRFDIGDGEGNLIAHIRNHITYCLSPDSVYHSLWKKEGEEYYQEQIEAYTNSLNTFIPFLEKNSELTQEDNKLFDEIMSFENEWFPDYDAIESSQEESIEHNESQSIYEQFTEQWNKYSQIKEKHSNSMVLYEVNDSFEIMGKDAERFSELSSAEILSKRVSKEHTVSMCSISGDELEQSVELIRSNGLSVVLASMEDGELVLRGMEATGTHHNPFEADYRLLSRLKQDCEYYLGYGSRADKHLWAGDVDSQIAKMRELYEKLPDKPEWLSKQDIDNYEAKMKNSVVELPTPKLDRSTVIQPSIPLSDRHNFKLSDNEVELVSKKERFRRNVKAINILKECEFDNRLATPEEQIALSKYVGWGGIPEAFDENNSSWSNEFKELYVTLSPDEYASARESTLTAFYTPSEVISSMYQALVNLGFKSGNILEPSCGTGNFIGMLPESMGESKIHGVELDPISAKIAQQLYQKASIASQGFEETNLPDNFFDVVIGNVPFGDFKVLDKRYDKHNFLIHDYFFAKSLDKLRPGGVMALITSSGTMDKKNSNVRKYISQRADLLGAIRLPNNTFKGNAGTEVVSDILFLQKKERMVDYDSNWLNVITDENGYEINEYFVNHPEMVLGELKTVSGRFGPQLTCVPKSGTVLTDELSNAITNITGIYKEAVIENEEATQHSDETLPADPNVRNFSYTLVNNRIYFRENSIMTPEEPSATATKRIKGMIEIRDSVRRLIELQSENYPDSEIAQEQKHLNECYDRFTKTFDFLNSRGNKLAFQKDSSYPLLSSLEILDENGKFVEKADMFTKRTITPHVPVTSVDTSSEALALSLGEEACIDIDYMSELTGKSELEIFEDLKGVIFLNPLYESGTYHQNKYLTADEYLSGNVREKLAWAERSAKLYPEDYTINVEALKRVQPKDLSASEISVRLGSTWVPTEDIRDFIIELLTPNRYSQYEIKVHFSEHTGEWRIDGKSSDPSNVKANTTYGTGRANAYKIIENTLNLTDVKVFDYIDKPDGTTKAVLNKKETALAQAKQEQIKQAFAEWIWKEPNRRDRLTKSYNEKFNSLRPREFDGSHLSFVGMNPEIKLRPHQKNAVAHIIYGGNTLLAHAVGAGKSFEMVAAAKELKRLGLCSKPMFVVPNHLTEQWASEFLRLYPASNILVATKKDFERKNRQRFCGRIATGDYDAIIIGHSQFEKIPMSVEYQRHSLESQIDEIMEEVERIKRQNGSNFTVKQLEKSKKSLSNRLHKLNDQSRKDDLVTFEELGVDHLFVDESHYYKNLYLYTKMRNVGGIAQTEAQKASDLFMKCQYLDSITDGKGIVFATGTPISNSMVELYTIQRYLQYNTLQQHNLQNFDSWASTFGETVSAIELTPEGKGYRSKTRFAKFHNLPELMSMFKEVADIQTADMLNLPVPKANYINVSVKPSEFQKELVNSLAERAEKIRTGNVDASTDNMLKITNDGRNLALDQRLIDDTLPDFEGSKTNACVDNVYRIWSDTKDKKSTQLVFCDLSTPKDDGSFSVYNDIKKKLIERGVPEKEIEFIHDAKTDAQKLQLFQRTRSGEVRVLMGSTQKMGAGTNVQDRLVALHDLDCPWRPSDLEQRSGRIIRQGNTNEEVFIYRYVTEETFDAYLYQLVEGKQKFASQIMTSKSPARSAEDVDATALSYAEIKMLATGNPYIKEKMDLDIQVQKLKLLKSEHLTVKYSLEDKIIKYYPQRIAYLTSKIGGLKDDLETVNAHPRGVKDSFNKMEINGTIYTERATAGQALVGACSGLKSSEPIPVGAYRGFTLELAFDLFMRKYYVNVTGKTRTRVELSVDNVGNIIRIDNAIDKCFERLSFTENELEETIAQFENAKLEVNKPFPHEEELNTKLERLSELNALLNVDEKVIEVTDTPSEETIKEDNDLTKNNPSKDNITQER